jgi:gamma-glutamyltranspeptidase/glutathione hydrolase
MENLRRLAGLTCCVAGLLAFLSLAADALEGSKAGPGDPAPLERIGSKWPYPMSGSPPVSSSGMIATDAALATNVGADVILAGGNAVDAAVAIAFALAVVHPRAGNLGGGGFAIVRTVDGKLAALDFREKAPLAASRDMYLDENGDVSEESVTGHLASGVPGTVAGLWALHQRYGSTDWDALLAPAINLADHGFVADTSFCSAIRNEADRLMRYPASARLLLPNGEAVEPGARWANPDLAATLRRIAESGPKDFYEGETADLIVAEMESGGGLITHEDLNYYEPRWREPITFKYRGCTVVSMPPPSSGGLTLALIAHILEGYDLAGLGWHSVEALHLTAEAMRRGFAYRNYYLGDPDFVKMPYDLFLSKEHAAELRSTISPDRATPSADVSPGGGDDGTEGMNTTHFSIADALGNTVALTTTLNLSFGSAVTVDGAGFLLNNEMDDFAAKPGAPNAFGLVQSEANAIAPGKRMLSSMTPTIVVKGELPLLVTGASGGPRIISGVFQVMSNVIDYGFGVVEAVNAPRIHHQHLPDRIQYERGGLTDSQIEGLRAMGHEVVPRDGRIAVAASILRRGVYWTGAPDPRLGGSASGPE